MRNSVYKTIFVMAAGFVAVRQVRMIGIISVQATPKEPLARATKVTRSMSGYRTTNGNIAAIDFGTTSVSVAFTTSGDKDVNTVVLDQSNQDTRIPNTLLLKRTENGSTTIISVGNDATTVYSKLRASDRCNYIYFERIKMLMKRDKVVCKYCNIIIWQFILYRSLIVNHLLSHFRESHFI